MNDNKKKWENRIVGHGLKPAKEFLANPYNWRTHPKPQQNALRGSLDDIGWIQQVIENKTTGNMIDGHLRVELALAEGDDEMVPVVYVELSEQEELLALATLDPIGEMAKRDKEKLNELLELIDDDELETRELLDSLMDDPGADIDHGEELLEKYGIMPGQIWRMGNHLLLCGDSTEQEQIRQFIGDDIVRLAVTSPPYFVGKEYKKQKSIESINEFVRKSCITLDQVVNKDYSRIVINTGTGFTTAFSKNKKRHTLIMLDKWTDNLHDLGWNLRYIRHWIKEGQLLCISARSDLIDQHCEFIGTYDYDDGQEMQFNDWPDQNDVELIGTFYNDSGKSRGTEKVGHNWALRGYWAIKGEAGSHGHCASFPLEIPERNIMLYSRRGEIVYDPFIGAGTTIVACERMGRICRGVEMDPKYCAITLQRWADLTGDLPALENNII